MTVREMIQMLLLNSDLDDKIDIETKHMVSEISVPKYGDPYMFCHSTPKRVYHCGNGETVIECHDD